MIDWFLKRSFKFKILFSYIVGLVFIGIVGYGYFTYSQITYFNKEMQKMKKEIYKQNKDIIKTAVNVAENTINIAQYLSSKGIVSEEKAKKIAIYELNSIKYGQSGYVWCLTEQGVLIADPPRGDLVGKNVLNYKDKNGFRLFKAAIDTLKMKDSAFMQYYWVYPNTNTDYEKITYIKKVHVWDWIVGSGIYVRDIENQFNLYKKQKLNELKKSILSSITPGVISFLVVFFILYIMLNKIMLSVEEVAEISDRLAKGYVDIDMKLPELVSKGPIAKLIKNTNSYIENTYNFINFKEKTELCSTEEDILNHIKEFLENEMNVENFAIYLLGDKKQKQFYKKGDINCLEFEKCIKLSRKNIYEECMDKKRLYACIPITSNDEALAIVQIAFDKESQIKSKINILKNYIQSTASSIKIRKLNERLKHLSLRDQLTGLYNRRFLDEFFSTYESTIKRHNITTVAAMADIDNFKCVNDTFGHQVGDDILKNVSTIAKTIFKRNSDLIIRYGGEEFLIILQDTNELDAADLLEEFRIIVESQEHRHDNDIIQKTISVGWCIMPNDTDNLKKAISYADLALYKAKSTGKNKTVKFDNTILNETYKLKEGV